MLGFTPGTQPVAMKEWVTPLDPSIYAQGVANQAKRLEAQSAEDSELYNSFMSIQAIAPQDEEQLQNLKQNFEKELSGLSMGDLRNPQTKAQLSQIQNKYTNLLLESGIPQRTSSYKQELAAKKDAEAKGRQYVSPLLRQAEKYIKDGNFYKDTRFNQQGFVAPDNKELDEIAKNTPEWENWVTEGGYDIHKKGKAESSLYNNYLTHFTNNPQWSALLNDQFEQQIENLDLNEVVSQGLNGISQLFPNLPPDKQQEALNDLQQGLAMQQNNPYLQSAIKDKLRNDYFKNQAYMAAQAKTYANTVDKKANEFEKIARENVYKIELQKANNDLKLKEIEARIEANKDKLEVQKELLQQKLEFQKQSQDAKIQAEAAKTELQLKKLEAQTQKEEEKQNKKEVVREDVSSFRDIYSSNPEAINELLIKRVGKLGWNFDKDDIEKVTWNKDSNRYEVEIDDLGYGNSTVSFTQEEIDNLKIVTYKKGDEIITIPLNDPDAKEAIKEAEKQGYKKQ